jgi:cytidylate kinase
VAQRVAQALGFHFLDSGALYRLVALAALKRALPLDEADRLAQVALDLNVRFDPNGVFLDEEDVTLAIRSEEVSLAASQVAALVPVRHALLDRQRAFQRAPGLVADGRDMGSVVFPHAVLKVFLTATPEARAERRYKQLIDKGIRANLDALLQDINQRDARDQERSVAPLQKCKDAYLLDTTNLSVDQVVEQVLRWCEPALQQLPSRLTTGDA